ncbi:MAG: UDP-glucuronic acid decarboxylase family protein [bacterium]
MDILVTGGAGFLGNHLCRRFVDEGHKVYCFDNLVTGNRKNVEDLLETSKFELIEQDVTEYIDISNHHGKLGRANVELVVHFASLASPVDYLKYPIKTLKVGALGTHRTLGVAKEFVAKFLLASTSEVYGDPVVHPQPEDYWGNVNPIGVRGVYDESKRFAEALTMAYHRSHGLDTRIVRIFNTYGPGMRLADGRAVPNFIKQALQGEPLTVYGDGEQTRSFCFVDDLIEGISRLLETDYHQPVNIGNPDEMTILELAELLIEMTDTDSEITYKPLPKDDPQVRQPDISLARELLDWQPRYTLKEGLQKTIPYFQKELQKQTD